MPNDVTLKVAPADQITIPVTPPAVVPATFTSADIEAARKQEKDKLYATTQSWEDKFAEQGKQLAEILKDRAAGIEEAKAEATKVATDAAEKAWNEADSKGQVATMRSEFEAKLAAMEASRDVERATFAKERTFTELRDYTSAQVSKAMENNEIAPELAGYVTGNNAAEIDASLIKAKGITETLLSNIAAATAAQEVQRTAPRGVSPTGHAPVGPMDTDASHKTFSATDIKNMSIEEYAKNRGSFLGAAANSARDRGMFG